MASTLPSVSDCCSLCEGLTVTVDASGVPVRQVFSGNGNPNTIGQQPDDPGIENLYYNLDVPGELWWWDIANQNWF